MAKQADPAETLSDMKYTIVGEQEHGKTVLALSFARQTIASNRKIWLWNTDGRSREYTSTLGHAHILVPATPNLLDVRAVRDEVIEDVTKGALKDVGLCVMDNATHAYQMQSMETMADKREGDKGASHIDKALSMSFLRNAMLVPGKDFLILAHIYKGGDNVGNMKYRQSLSDLEMSRLVMITNAKLGVVRDGNKFGVCAIWFRYRRIEPFTLWDEPGGMFATMPDRIREALYNQNMIGEWTAGISDNLAQALKLQPAKSQTKAPAAPPKPAPPAPPTTPIAPAPPALNGSGGGGNNGTGGDKKVTFALLEHGAHKAFPEPVPDTAIAAALEYYLVHNEVKVYPFGNSEESREMATNAYNQIKSGQMPGYVQPKNSKEMAERWVAYVKYLAKLAVEDRIALAEPESKF